MRKQRSGINEGADSDSLYCYLVKELAKLDLVYVHLAHCGNDALLKELRKRWPNTLLLNRIDRPLDALGADIENGLADMETVGRWALANPDFVERFKADAPLNTPDHSSFYGMGAAGYTDYPFLSELSPVNA